MPTFHNVLAPCLAPNALLDISLPTSLAKGETLEQRSVVRQFELGSYKDSEPLGLIKKISIGERDENKVAALADSTHRITLASLPTPIPSFDAEEQLDEDAEDDEDLKIIEQYKIKPGRKSDSWVGLEVLPTGVLSTLSSGKINLSSPSSSSSTSIPSPLTCLQTLSPDASQFVAAGKEVDVSIWDMEKVFSRSSVETSGAKESAGKRKKGELEAGEVWRARNLPNNGLSLRTPIHHLCLAVLPTSAEGSSGSTSIVTGTKSGHIRRYDTRQRKPVDGWKVAREGGVGVVRAGENEHELFFADTSSLLGSLDLRTGRLLYGYASQTCTPHSLLPLPTLSSSSFSRNGKKIGLVTLSSDATLRACSTTAPPKEGKGNIVKGEILGGLGGIGFGSLAYYGTSEREEEEVEVDGNEDGEDVGEAEEEEVWDDMVVVEEGEEVASDDEEDESTEEEATAKSKAKKRKGGKR